MTQEEKELLLKDLCGRLPYGVIIKTILNNGELIGFDTGREELHLRQLNDEIFNRYYTVLNDDPKPYLRSISSMTEEEESEYNLIQGLSHWTADDGKMENYAESIDWLNSHHFDYRGLIEKGLALEASEGMYNVKTE